MGLIKILIIDDDIEILQGLVNLIDWNFYGCEIVGQADNGEDALMLAKQYGPDIIITDIAMPTMSGLELIREVKKLYPETKSIILTCHKDFDYAKEAIELETEFYLTKYTLTEEELIKAISKVKEKINREKSLKEAIHKANWGLKLNSRAIKENFFKDILDSGSKDFENVISKAGILDINLPEGPFRVLGLFIDDYKIAIKNFNIKDDSLLNFSVQNIAEDIFDEEENVNIFSFNMNEYFVVFSEKYFGREVKQKLINNITELQKNIMAILNVRLSVCISKVFDEISRINAGISEVRIMRESYFYKTGEIIVKEHIAYSNDNTEELYEKYAGEIKTALIGMDKGALDKCLEEIFQIIEKHRYSPKSVIKFFRQLSADLQSLANKKGILFEMLDVECNTLEGYKNLYSDITNEFFVRQSGTFDISTRKEIKRVLEYMEKNLERNITCEMMSEYVNMNSNYFSRFFKNEVGMNFSEYLLKMKIQRATTLLNETELTAEEISKAVGFENASYFYRIYKKVTGKTTREIRGGNMH
jgi:two-component system response regulator YesN